MHDPQGACPRAIRRRARPASGRRFRRSGFPAPDRPCRRYPGNHRPRPAARQRGPPRVPAARKTRPPPRPPGRSSPIRALRWRRSSKSSSRIEPMRSWISSISWGVVFRRVAMTTSVTNGGHAPGMARCPCSVDRRGAGRFRKSTDGGRLAIAAAGKSRIGGAGWTIRRNRSAGRRAPCRRHGREVAHSVSQGMTTASAGGQGNQVGTASSR